MSTTTELVYENPFSIISVAIKETKVREANNAAEALQRDRAMKAEREARVAEEAAARQAAALVENAFKFQQAFAFAVVKSDGFKKVKSVAQEDILRYCTALASTDQPLPGIDSEMANLVNDKFVYGVVLAGIRIPEGYFVGQRQDWFQELYDRKQGLDRPAPIKYEEVVARPKVVYSTASAVKPVSESPSAITPKTSKIRGAQPKGK